MIPQDRATVPIPDTGARVTVVGPKVWDTAHGWPEIHPAWWISSGRDRPREYRGKWRGQSRCSGILGARR